MSRPRFQTTEQHRHPSTSTTGFCRHNRTIGPGGRLHILLIDQSSLGRHSSTVRDSIRKGNLRQNGPSQIQHRRDFEFSRPQRTIYDQKLPGIFGKCPKCPPTRLKVKPEQARKIFKPVKRRKGHDHVIIYQTHIGIGFPGEKYGAGWNDFMDCLSRSLPKRPPSCVAGIVIQE